MNHGYIPGEVHTCPDCGEKTEVYSRITGYYRPVQNWNDGKTQEYKDRKVYNADHSILKEHELNCAHHKESSSGKVDLADGVYLFKTPTCAKCKVAIPKLQAAGIDYTEINANENQDLALALNVKTAPSLVVVKGGNYETKADLTGVLAYIEGAKKANA